MVNGPRMNGDYRTVARQVEEARATRGAEKKRDLNDLSSFPIERARLRSLRNLLSAPLCLCAEMALLTMHWSTAIFFFLLIACTIVYGWTLDRGIHLAAPLAMQFFSELARSRRSQSRAHRCPAVGLSCTSIFNSISTLVVDMYPGQSASATAANNLYRCLCGAIGTAVIDPILSALGAGACGMLWFSCGGGLISHMSLNRLDFHDALASLLLLCAAHRGRVEVRDAVPSGAGGEVEAARREEGGEEGRGAAYIED